MTRAAELVEIRSRLRTFYDSESEVEQWLASPHRLLSGDRPGDRVEAGQAADVFALLDQLESGAYV